VSKSTKPLNFRPFVRILILVRNKSFSDMLKFTTRTWFLSVGHNLFVSLKRFIMNTWWGDADIHFGHCPIYLGHHHGWGWACSTRVNMLDPNEQARPEWACSTRVSMLDPSEQARPEWACSTRVSIYERNTTLYKKVPLFIDNSRQNKRNNQMQLIKKTRVIKQFKHPDSYSSISHSSST
jgi:hypothetical protein